VAPDGRLQLAMTSTEGHATEVVIRSTGGCGTVVFRGEEGDSAVPAQQSKGLLEDTWRIQPQQLKCRQEANGELVKLGHGRRHT